MLLIREPATPSARAERLVVDTGRSATEVLQQLRDQLVKWGVRVIDAPTTGGKCHRLGQMEQDRWTGPPPPP